MAEATITAKQLAQAVGTDPKTFRRFLRANLHGDTPAIEAETPGQGGRYAFTKGEAKKLARAYKVWAAPKVKVPKVTEAEEAELTEAELEEFELTDEDLEGPDEEEDESSEEDDDEDEVEDEDDSDETEDDVELVIDES